MRRTMATAAAASILLGSSGTAGAVPGDARLSGVATIGNGLPAANATGLLSALDAAGDDHPVTTFAADATGAFSVEVPASPELLGYAAGTGGRLFLEVRLSVTMPPAPGAAPVLYRTTGAAEAAVVDAATGRAFASPAPDRYVLQRADGGSGTGGDVNVARQASARKRTVCRNYAWRANCPANKKGAYGWQTMVIQDVTTQMYHWNPNCFLAPGTIDGYFGPKTEFAVRSYQKCQGLVDDGIVGFDTWGFFWDQDKKKGLEHRTKHTDTFNGYCWSQNGTSVCVKDGHCDPTWGDVDHLIDLNPYDTTVYGWQQHRVPGSSNANDDRWTVLDNRNGKVGGCHYMVDDFS
jgi:peptidoglycan hydrolase-like protein with peptidoglycan-binding domain